MKGVLTMPTIVKTMKLQIATDEHTDCLFKELTQTYASACNMISQYVFDHEFILIFEMIHDVLYHTIREVYGLKSQMAISAVRTVVARYKTVKTQLFEQPFCYKNEEDRWISITRTLEWLWRPIHFRRPQADLVRGRDYSFVKYCCKISNRILKKHISLKIQPMDYTKYSATK